ncbi:hypothetical protein ATY75_31945 [Rhizobium sp. N122]|nr:hypothetical protein ATY75_31945 [Rhizobium sp. N122]
MLSGDQRFTVLCSHGCDPACVELAAIVIRAYVKLHYIEPRDVAGNRILAYRDQHPEEASFRI